MLVLGAVVACVCNRHAVVAAARDVYNGRVEAVDAAGAAGGREGMMMVMAAAAAAEAAAASSR